MKTLTLLLILFFPALLLAQQAEQGVAIPKSKQPQTTPFLQLSGGMVHSSIDLSRYISSIVYRGNHIRLAAHLKGLFFVSAEYSKFRVHDSPSAWKDIDTRKFDLNTHLSFATNNNLTRIFAIAGVNKHEWRGTRTKFTDQSQLANGIPEGEIVYVDRIGFNFGCGFTQTLYEDIGVFGDYRFCFGRSSGYEKVRIMDVMTTLGVSLSIPYPERRKHFGIGNKIYKWTKKGAQ